MSVQPLVQIRPEHSSARVARTLFDAGWTDVRGLIGGFDAWRTAGYPVEPGTNEKSRSVEPQLSIKEIQGQLAESGLG